LYPTVSISGVGFMAFNTLRSIVISAFFILILTLSGQSLFSASARDCNGDFASDEVLVTLNSPASLPGVALQFGLNPTPIEQFGTEIKYRLRIIDNVSPCAKSDALIQDARVQTASPNFFLRPPDGSGIINWSGGPQRFKGTEYGFLNQWAFQNINLAEAQQQSQGADIIVAVLDTGIDLTHPIFNGRLLQGYDFVNNDTDPSEVYVEGSRAYGHGTHVAGIIAQIAPQAKILPVRVLDGNGVGNDWVLSKALRYVAGYSDPQGNRVKVFNMSFTARDRSDFVEGILHDTVKGRTSLSLGIEPGIVAVVAAGNSNSNLPHYPAAESVCEDQILSVAASSFNNDLTYFSNYSSSMRCKLPTDPLLPWVNVMAPGYRIVSAMPGGRYGTWSGTSMSAPFIAGIAALVRAKHPTQKADDVGCHIKATAITSPNPIAPPRINALTTISSTFQPCPN
jgi:subtilisin family serine protease